MKKNSRYNYTDSEKELLKVLKMQENELSSLAKDSNEQKAKLEDIRKRIEKMTSQVGVKSPAPKAKKVEQETLHLSKDEIPTWNSIVSQANQEIKEDVVIEDLLSAKEFQYCREDIKRINENFEKRTGLNKIDAAYIVVATALQTARWLLIQHFMGDLGQKIDSDTRFEHNASEIKDEISRKNLNFQGKHYPNHGHRGSKKGYRSWEQIIFNAAPYDATRGAKEYNINMGGKHHRYKTLGHDPILGWIFGTANIITNTITLSDFSSFRISKGGLHFEEPVDMVTIFYETIDSVLEDWLRLPAGIFAQAVHLKSDAFTKLGLPVPLLEAFSENLAGKLYKSQYDSLCLLRDTKILGSQATIAIIINMIIGLIHGYFYNKEKDGAREFYEVRTRKILSISNSLATVGNITYAAISADWNKLDIGGIFVTVSRLFSDIRYTSRLKEKFIQEKLYNLLEQEMEDVDKNFI